MRLAAGEAAKMCLILCPDAIMGSILSDSIRLARFETIWDTFYRSQAEPEELGELGELGELEGLEPEPTCSGGCQMNCE